MQKWWVMTIVACLVLGFSVYLEASPVRGVESPYSRKLEMLKRDWKKARGFCRVPTDAWGIQTIGIRTEGRPYYVGFKKCMRIDAPIAAVQSVIDDSQDYAKLFPGVEKVNEVYRESNTLILGWEKIIPVFFVPNEKYQILYRTDKSNPNRTVYTYQLFHGDRLKFNDGLEVLERESDDTTLFYNYEFYEADYDVGILGIKAISSPSVWEESVRGSYVSLLSIRQKAEHPELSYGQIRRNVEEMTKGKLPAVSFE